MTTATLNVEHFSSVIPTDANRFSSGIDELDWLYGHNPINKRFGIPRKVMTLLAGSAGIGKTRFTMTLVKSVLRSGLRVLYFTCEMPKGTFKHQYCKNVEQTAEFYISEERDLNAQVQIIDHVNPDLVIVDSVNRIKQYNSSQRSIDLIEQTYRREIERSDSHVIFIGHLNAQGGVKGGTYLPHMVDIVFAVRKWMANFIEVACDDKNRYGQTGKSTKWAHEDHGVECRSDRRFDDKAWKKGKRRVITRARRKLLGLR